MKIENSCTIITGGARGIGKCVVDLIISKGGNIIIADILDKEGEDLANAINKQQGEKKAVFAHTDVRELKEIESLFELADKEFGGAQILINNAGILDGENSENDINKLINVFDTNLKAVFQGTLLARQHFQNQLESDSSKQFCIVSTSSLSAIKPCLSFPVYSFTKNAIMNMTQIFSNLKWKNIRINAVAPSFTRTKFLKDEINDNTELLDNCIGLVEPTLVAQTILELIEDSNSNGVVRALEADKIYDANGVLTTTVENEIKTELAKITSISGLISKLATIIKYTLGFYKNEKQE